MGPVTGSNCLSICLLLSSVFWFFNPSSEPDRQKVYFTTKVSLFVNCYSTIKWNVDSGLKHSLFTIVSVFVQVCSNLKSEKHVKKKNWSVSLVHTKSYTPTQDTPSLHLTTPILMNMCRWYLLGLSVNLKNVNFRETFIVRKKHLNTETDVEISKLFIHFFLRGLTLSLYLWGLSLSC